MSATPMDIARSAVAHQMAGNRAWHQPAFLVMNSAVNFADQMATNAAEKGNVEMHDAYAAVTSYLSESRDRLTARYPVVNLNDLAADAYRPTPQDHGPLAAVLSDRTLAKVLSRPAHVPSGEATPARILGFNVVTIDPEGNPGAARLDGVVSRQRAQDELDELAPFMTDGYTTVMVELREVTS
jgi:hypothetical protein